MLGGIGPIYPPCRQPLSVRIVTETPPKDALPVIDILNLALPYFGVIFVGFA
jgi:hypothetical protein